MNKENASIVWAIWKEISKERFAEIKDYNESDDIKNTRREELHFIECNLESILDRLQDQVITGFWDGEIIFREKTSNEKRLDAELLLEAKRLTAERD